MYQGTFYKLQIKKAVWFLLMGSLASLAVVSSPLAPLTMLGIAAGVALPNLLPFMPLGFAAPLIVLSPLIAAISPIALSFNMGFMGVMMHRIFMGGQTREALKKKHDMGKAEAEDLATLNKLETKTNIHIDEKKICDVDEKKFIPNAAASGTYENSIYIFSNIIKAPFTHKERKAIFAHEFGHINHHDSALTSITSILFWLTTAVSVFTFSFPLAMLAMIGSRYCYYAISQIDELLADQFSARQTNPKALMSALDKLNAVAKPIRERQREERTLSQWPKAILSAFDHAVGMTSHPPVSVRKSYLEEYAAEKEAAKIAPT